MSTKEEKKKCFRELKDLRSSLHHLFRDRLPILKENLLKYADELDEVYTDIKISKVAGHTGCVVGGVLYVVGFGLSFVTFGSSLGLCIAGGLIGGAGGITTGGATIADCVKGRNAQKLAEAQLKAYTEELVELLERCKSISDKFERLGNIDTKFPFWCEFWGKFFSGSGKMVGGFALKMIATTVIDAIKLAKAKTCITSAAVSVFRTLGKTAKGFHIVGGFASAALLPFDFYNLVSNSIELHENEAHSVSKQIRQVVSKLQTECPRNEVDDMVRQCMYALTEC